jgi:hypothetical protein
MPLGTPMKKELSLEEFTKLYDEHRRLTMELLAENHGLSEQEIRVKLQRVNKIEELMEGQEQQD